MADTDLKNIIETNLKIVMKEPVGTDDLIRYLIAIAEFRRGHITGAFVEIVNKYPDCKSAACVFKAFWSEISNHDNWALEVIDSLRGDRELLYKIENILAGTICRIDAVREDLWLSKDATDVIKERIDKIRDRWLEQVIEYGIEPAAANTWEPQLAYDEENDNWHLLAVPLSYKLYERYRDGGNASEEEAPSKCHVFSKLRYAHREDALFAFRLISDEIAKAGPDSATEKFTMVRLIQKYSD